MPTYKVLKEHIGFNGDYFDVGDTFEQASLQDEVWIEKGFIEIIGDSVLDMGTTIDNEQLRNKIAEHRFITVHQEALPSSVKIRWVLGNSGADEIMDIVNEYIEALLRQRELEARIDEHDYISRNSDMENTLGYFLQDRMIELAIELRSIQSPKKEEPNDDIDYSGGNRG